MSRLNNYLTERSAGEDMETAIIECWNTGTIPPKLNDRITQDGVTNIVKQLRSLGVSGSARRIGAGQIPVSAKWKSYGYNQNKSIPKTDIIIGEYKISLKTGDGAQLMSGDKAETLATFYAAIELSGLNPTLYEGVLKQVQTFKKGTIFDPGHIGVQKLHQQNLDDDLLREAYKVIDAVGKNIEDAIQSNEAFSKAFALEAMTGMIKFGGSEGTCTHILSVSWDGSVVKYYECTDESYLKHISSQMKPSVSMKSASGGRDTRGYQVSLRLQITKLLKSTNEGIISDMMSKIKSIASSFSQMISNAFSGGLKYFLGFIGMEPEVTVNTEVKL